MEFHGGLSNFYKFHNMEMSETTKNSKYKEAKGVLVTKEVLERGFKDQLKWIIILMFGFASMIIALIKLI